MMKKIKCTLLVGAFFILLMGCGKRDDNQRDAQLNKVKKEEKEEQEILYTVDKERYEAYVEVLEYAVKYNVWPDGGQVLEENDLYYSEIENYFAICDIDLDGNEELLIEINTNCMAGQITRVFDYDYQKKEVVEQLCAFPSFVLYDNGILCEYDSHNQTGCDAIHPFSLSRYDAKTDNYKYVGSAYAVNRECYYGEYKEELDKDNDGIIYFVSDGDVSEWRECTLEEYQTWYNSYIKDAKEIYIPREGLYEWPVKELAKLLETEGAVKPIPLTEGELISSYDLNSDGKNDDLEIKPDKVEEDVYTDIYGSGWEVFLNGESVLKIKVDWPSRLIVKLYKVSNKRTYLYIELDSGYDFTVRSELYYMKKDKFVKDLDFLTCMGEDVKRSIESVTLQYMSGEALCARCSYQFNSTAYMDWLMNFQYNSKDNSWKLMDESFDLDYTNHEEKKDGMKAKRSFVVYDSYDSNEKAFTVEIGDVVVIDKIKFFQGRVYFHVKNKQGKEGWFPDGESPELEDIDWFEEAVHVG